MNRHLKALSQPLARSAIALASFTVSAACLFSVVLVFVHASSEPLLRDSARARLAVEATASAADATRPSAVAVVERRDRGSAGAVPLRYRP